MRTRPARIDCATTWPPGATVTGPPPGAFTPTHTNVFGNGIELFLDYYIQIRSE
jgi:hypothetical protein